MSEEKMVSVKLEDLIQAHKDALSGAQCCGCGGAERAVDVLAQMIRSVRAAPELTQVGYSGSAGLYRNREEAVRNGEQVIRRVYEIKDE